MLTSPIRKRAKTEDEKEQRRVERVLRNRRAAQSSRERKRLEVEALEKENQDLKAKVAMLENNQRALTEELTRLRKEFGVVTPSTSPLRMIPVTLSQELFSSQDAQASVTSNTLPEPTLSTSKTINPASLSPELRPVPDFTAQKQAKQPKQPKTTEPSESTLVPSPDVTQRPAVMLCDLPCHISAEMRQSFLASPTLTQPVLDLLPQLPKMLLSALETPSPWTSRTVNLETVDLKLNSGSSPLPPPPSMMNSWLATLRLTSATLPTLTSSTSTPSTFQALLPQSTCQRATTPLRTTAASTAKSSTLRIKFPQIILSSSPSLARPFVDATMAALRLVSERRDSIVGSFKAGSSRPRGDDELARCLGCIALSSNNGLLKSNGRSFWYELVAQDLRQATTTQEQLGQDEFHSSDLVGFNMSKSSTANMARQLEKAMKGQWRLMESRGSKVHYIPRKGSDNQVWGSLEFELNSPMAQPSDLTHLMFSPANPVKS